MGRIPSPSSWGSYKIFIKGDSIETFLNANITLNGFISVVLFVKLQGSLLFREPYNESFGQENHYLFDFENILFIIGINSLLILMIL